MINTLIFSRHRAAAIFLFFSFLLPVYAADLGPERSACEGVGCPASYGAVGVCPNGGSGFDEAYSVIVGGNLTTTNAAEAEGRILVGGDFSMQRNTGYNIGVAGVGSCVLPPANETHAFVGNDALTPTAGGNIIVGALTVAGDIEIGNTPTAAILTLCPGCNELPLSIPNISTLISDIFVDLSSRSACMRDFDVSTDLTTFSGILNNDGFGTIALTCPVANQTGPGGTCEPGTYIINQAGDLNVGFTSNVDASAFPSDGTATIIINMTDAGSIDMNIQSANGFGATYARYILWNFPNASTVNFLGNSQVDGTILIPNGDAVVNATGMNGRFFVSGNVSQEASGSEFHNYDFGGQIPDACEPVVGNPIGDLEVTKQVTGAAAPNPWDITISSSNCTLPAPYDTNPMVSTLDGSGGTVTFMGLAVNEGATMCSYDVSVGAQAGYNDTTAPGTLTGLMVSDGGTTQVTATCEEIIVPVVGNLEVTKQVTGAAAPNPWDITISSSNCTLPAPYDTNPTLSTTDGSGGTVTFMGLAVNEGATMCSYDVSVGAQAGYNDTTAPGTLTGLMVSDGGTTQVTATCEEIIVPVVGNLEVTKQVTGAAAPNPWDITISSSNCTLPAPYDTNPTLSTTDGSGGTVTFMGLAVNEGATMCSYDVSVGAQAGYNDTTAPGTLTGLMVSDGGTTQVTATCEEIIVPVVGNLEVTKQVTGAAAPNPWDITISSSNCTLPAPYDTNPTLSTTDGSGGTVTFMGLAVNEGATMCSYDVSIGAQAGYNDTTAPGTLTGLMVTDGGTTQITATCEEIVTPVGNLEVTKQVTGAAAPNPWNITISSSNCTLPAPYDTNPTLSTVDGSGGTVTFMGLSVNEGATMCSYDVSIGAQAGYNDTTAPGTLTGLMVTDGGTTQITATCEEIVTPVGNLEVTKQVTGAAAPNPWNITISSSNCTLPAPYDANPILSTVDGSGGVVTFVNLPVSEGATSCNYDVSVAAQAGYTDTTPAGTLTGLTVSDGGTTQVTATCTAPTLLTLGDFVWYDNNQDGIQDAGEFGVNGITVNLYNNANCSGASLDTTTTTLGGVPMNDGWYTFTDLPVGDYCVEFTNLPTGWVVTLQNQGSNDTLDSDADPVTGQIQNINLTADDPNEDVGIYAATGIVSGQIFCDDNPNNGISDPGEGQPNLGVILLSDANCDGVGESVFATQDTDAQGNYAFINLPVAFAPPPPVLPPIPQVCYVLTYDEADPDLGTCSLPFLPEEFPVDLNTDDPETTGVNFGNIPRGMIEPRMVPVNPLWALCFLLMGMLWAVKRRKVL
ncbi:SdrD B-like domain-containing protein [Marinicella sp. W31]|uniref:SdrD B-like domain-containing protein n=1 Tax=Marinicella sp. W31 TaxID=3023713 RepID=UPI0037562E98